MGFPHLAGHHVPLHDRNATRTLPKHGPVRLVTQRSRNAVGLVVVGECIALRPEGTKSIERKVKANALDIHPAQRRARAWEIFVQQHRSVTQALADDFDSVFGKAFARAYERSVSEIAAQEPPGS